MSLLGKIMNEQAQDLSRHLDGALKQWHANRKTPKNKPEYIKMSRMDGRESRRTFSASGGSSHRSRASSTSSSSSDGIGQPGSLSRARSFINLSVPKRETPSSSSENVFSPRRLSPAIRSPRSSPRFSSKHSKQKSKGTVYIPG